MTTPHADGTLINSLANLSADPGRILILYLHKKPIAYLTWMHGDMVLGGTIFGRGSPFDHSGASTLAAEQGGITVHLALLFKLCCAKKGKRIVHGRDGQKYVARHYTPGQYYDALALDEEESAALTRCGDRPLPALSRVVSLAALAICTQPGYWRLCEGETRTRGGWPLRVNLHTGKLTNTASGPGGKSTRARGVTSRILPPGVRQAFRALLEQLRKKELSRIKMLADCNSQAGIEFVLKESRELMQAAEAEDVMQEGAQAAGQEAAAEDDETVTIDEANAAEGEAEAEEVEYSSDESEVEVLD